MTTEAKSHRPDFERRGTTNARGITQRLGAAAASPMTGWADADSAFPSAGIGNPSGTIVLFVLGFLRRLRVHGAAKQPRRGCLVCLAVRRSGLCARASFDDSLEGVTHRQCQAIAILRKKACSFRPFILTTTSFGNITVLGQCPPGVSIADRSFSFVCWCLLALLVDVRVSNNPSGSARVVLVSIW